MARPATTHDFTLAVTPPGHDDPVEALEQRVRRLENAIAALQDTQLMEDRVVERVRQRVELHHLDGPRPSGGFIVTAARMLLPKSVDDVRPEEPPAQSESVAADGTATAAPAAPPQDAARPGWLLVELYRELRTMLRMFTDYRYRMSWSGKVVIPAALAIAFVSWFLFSGRLWVLGDVVDKSVDLVLVILVYKALSREVQRYRDLLARVYRYR